MAANIAEALAGNEARRAAVVACLAADGVLPPDLVGVAPFAAKVSAFAVQLEERIRALRAAVNREAQKKMVAEVQELQARKLLAAHETAVLNEIERKKRLAAYGLCVDETRTQAITAKSTAVTKVAVSQKLKQSFQEELGHLGFRHMDVELRERLINSKPRAA